MFSGRREFLVSGVRKTRFDDGTDNIDGCNSDLDLWRSVERNK